MSYEVKILADSIGPNGVRLTTFQLKYPRYIHSEMMTHRLFSRNASSSRAIPIEKMFEWIESDVVMPVHWGSKKKGMQSGEQLTGDSLSVANLAWIGAFRAVLGFAKIMNAVGLHKQIVNRMLEPWGHINVVLTATDFDNFFCLRCHKDAQPEIQVLAVMMAIAYRDSVATFLPAGDWHLPYVSKEEIASYPINDCIKFSASRCCRISYLTMEGKTPDAAKDRMLHDQLIDDYHMSPLEHQACSMEADDYSYSGNFRGWLQYRKSIPMDSYQKFDYSTLDNFPNGYRIN